MIMVSPPAVILAAVVPTVKVDREPVLGTEAKSASSAPVTHQ